MKYYLRGERTMGERKEKTYVNVSSDTCLASKVRPISESIDLEEMNRVININCVFVPRRIRKYSNELFFFQGRSVGELRHRRIFWKEIWKNEIFLFFAD